MKSLNKEVKVNKPVIQNAIFNLDNGFGYLRTASQKDSVEIFGIDLKPGTANIIKMLKNSKVKLILLIPRELPDKALDGLRSYLPGFDLLFAYSVNFEKNLLLCLKQLGAKAEKTMFVADDRFLRNTALKQGCRVAPHPKVGELIAMGIPFAFAEVVGARSLFVHCNDVIPYALEQLPEGMCRLLGIFSENTLSGLIQSGCDVARLPFNGDNQDVLRIKLEKNASSLKNATQKLSVLSVKKDILIAAIGPDVFNDETGITGRHGCLEMLMPQPELLSKAPDASLEMKRSQYHINHWEFEKVLIDLEDLRPLFPPVLIPFCPGTAASIQADTDRLTGVSNLDGSGTIISRHTRHADNARVVSALESELRGLGFCTWKHDFSYAGNVYQNVIAQMPGKGYYIIKPDILDRIRDIFVRFPFPDPPGPWLSELEPVLGEKWLRKILDEKLTPMELRLKLEALFQLTPWQPWWTKLCKLPGLGAKIVLLGSHFDSTASSSAGFNFLTSPAPGADDNASGVAGMLAIARWLCAFRGRLRHSVRLCFFNAEEQGMLGSKAYASYLKSHNAPLKATICMDMLGYNSHDSDIFEIHAGYTDASVRDASVPIAEKIAAWAETIGGVEPQIYKGTNSGFGADRDVYDPAINRSDHSSFHQEGYPAVTVGEDFFANLPTEASADPNPNYHTLNDTVIDADYAKKIVCAIAHSVVELAS